MYSHKIRNYNNKFKCNSDEEEKMNASQMRMEKEKKYGKCKYFLIYNNNVDDDDDGFFFSSYIICIYNKIK